MLNKKGDTTTLQVAISLIIVLIVTVSCTTHTYKTLNPNCDPSSVDVFNNFIKYYEQCKNKQGDCGLFDYSDIGKGDQIIVKPEGLKFENTIINLKCNGKDSFMNKKKIDVGMCFKDRENIRPAEEEDSINIYYDEDNALEYYKDNSVSLFNIGQNGLCFVLIGETLQEYARKETKKEISKIFD